jgi:hypothetical protein
MGHRSSLDAVAKRKIPSCNLDEIVLVSELFLQGMVGAGDSRILVWVCSQLLL